MHQLTTPEAYFAALMARDSSRPFVTYYDEATGERSEMSVTSTANWVAKTHHFLGTELGLGVGDVAYVSLPAHWISVPVLLGCLTAGLALTDSAATPAAVGFVAEGGVDAVADDLYVVAPAPTGAPDDYIGAVRPQEDKWPTVHSPAGPGDPCLDGRSRAEVVALARSRAESLGLDAGARVLTTRSREHAKDWIDTLLAPLVLGGSLVYVANCADGAVLDRRAGQERATARVD